jgi:SAM-dependent methyltransferase
MGAPKPIGFRGGAFRFNHEILAAMAKRGITISFNYHTLASHQSNNAVNLPVFRWDNGIYEIPMSFIEYSGKLLAFDLNGEIDFKDHKKVHTLIDKFYASSSNDNVLVMLMHSWSLLHRNKDTGFYEYLNDNLAASFDQFLSKLPSDMRIVTATDLNHELQSQNLKVDITREIDLANRSKYGSADFTPGIALSSPGITLSSPGITLSSPGITLSSPDIQLVQNTSDDVSCNYCGTPKNLMEDFGGREKVRCPKCRSLERQRIFLWAYETFIKHEFDFANKTILLVTPSEAIHNYLKPIANLTTCDVRPVSWFDMQCDISKMPQVKSNSYDAVIAKAVMQHVFDDEAALDEIYRVIKPWGRFFMQTSSKLNSETASIEDISKHYGKEALEKYNVGTFRYYGDRSILRSLQKRFLVKTFYGIDPVTMRQDIIYCGIKDGKDII